MFLLVCDGEEDLKYVHSSSTLSFIFNKHSHSVTLTHNFKHALNNSSMAVLRPRRVFFYTFFIVLLVAFRAIPSRSPRTRTRLRGQEPLGELGAQLLQLGIGRFGDDAFGTDGFQERRVDLFHQAGFKSADVFDWNLI